MKFKEYVIGIRNKGKEQHITFHYEIGSKKHEYCFVDVTSNSITCLSQYVDAVGAHIDDEVMIIREGGNNSSAYSLKHFNFQPAS